MQKWEYKWLYFTLEERGFVGKAFSFELFGDSSVRGHDAIVSHVNTLGEEGWELVGSQYDGGSRTFGLWFKRPKS